MSHDSLSIGHFDLKQLMIRKDDQDLWPKARKLLLSFKYMGYNNAGKLHLQLLFVFLLGKTEAFLYINLEMFIY